MQSHTINITIGIARIISQKISKVDEYEKRKFGMKGKAPETAAILDSSTALPAVDEANNR